MASISRGSGSKPSGVTLYPKKLTSLAAKWHLRAPSLRLALRRRSNTALSLSKCSAQVAENTIMSSK